jgi:hypothetical protein
MRFFILILSLSLALPALAFIGGGGGGGGAATFASEAFHAQTVDNASGSGVILEGQFSGTLLHPTISDHEGVSTLSFLGPEGGRYTQASNSLSVFEGGFYFDGGIVAPIVISSGPLTAGGDLYAYGALYAQTTNNWFGALSSDYLDDGTFKIFSDSHGTLTAEHFVGDGSGLTGISGGSGGGGSNFTTGPVLAALPAGTALGYLQLSQPFGTTNLFTQIFITNATTAPPSAGSSLTNGLNAYYSFDTLTTDASGHGNTLTDHNATTHDPASKLGWGATFASASSQYLSIADNSYFQMGTGSFSIGAWLKYTSTGYEMPLGYGVYGVTGYWLQNSAGSLLSWIEDSGNVYIAGGAHNYNDGNWHYCLMTVDRVLNKETLFVDNAVETATDITAATTSVNNAAGFQIGALNAGQMANVSVDEVGVWNRVLTASERYQLFNGTNGSGSGTTYPFAGFSPKTNYYGLFVGDSIMMGYTNWTTAASGGPAGNTNGDVAVRLALNSSRQFIGTNYGVSGANMASIQGYADAGMNNNPDFIVLEGGVNDLAASSTFPAQAARFDHVLATAKAYGLPLFVEEVWPAAIASHTAITNWNAQLAHWVATNTGVSLILIHDLMADPAAGGTNLLPAYTFDLTHPTLAGVDMHAKVVWTNLASFYNQAPLGKSSSSYSGTFTGTFIGDGSGITALAATNLVGTVPAASIGAASIPASALQFPPATNGAAIATNQLPAAVLLSASNNWLGTFSGPALVQRWGAGVDAYPWVGGLFNNTIAGADNPLCYYSAAGGIVNAYIALEPQLLKCKTNLVVRFSYLTTNTVNQSLSVDVYYRARASNNYFSVQFPSVAFTNSGSTSAAPAARTVAFTNSFPPATLNTNFDYCTLRLIFFVGPNSALNLFTGTITAQ